MGRCRRQKLITYPDLLSPDSAHSPLSMRAQWPPDAGGYHQGSGGELGGGVKKGGGNLVV